MNSNKDYIIAEISDKSKYSNKRVMSMYLDLINKKRFLLPFPTPIAKLTAKFLQLMPKPLLTEDQLRLLKYDNISSGKYKTNFEIGVPSIKKFDDLKLNILLTNSIL